MPKIFIYYGFMIYVYTDDHLPVHIHVRIVGRESKFELRYKNGQLSVIHFKIKGKLPLKEHEVSEMKKFCRKYHLLIKNQWDAVHYYKKKPECITIREKV